MRNSQIVDNFFAFSFSGRTESHIFTAKIIMNEHIDLAFAGAEIAARNDEVASTVVHGLSAFYNIGQMARFRAMYCQGQYAYMNGETSVSASLNEQYWREMWKYTVAAGIDLVSFFLISYSAMRADR